MPTNSSAEVEAKAPWPPRVRLWLLLWNFFPLLHITVIGFAAKAVDGAWVLPAVPLLLFLPPPLLCRLILWRRPVLGGSHRAGQPEFLTWWATAQLQMIFCRLPVLEEILRLIPGLYSAWLRLWGARIGRLTFWSPGVQIFDRSFLQVGDDVVVGAGARLVAHVVLKTPGGPPLVQVAAIRIGTGCVIGGYSLLTVGSEVEENETVPSCAILPQFTVWRQGKRIKLASCYQPS